MKKHPPTIACPCGGLPAGASFADCCEPYVSGRLPAPTAEALMRSRYTAYTLGDEPYLLASWHASTRPSQLDLDPPGQPHGARWLGLAVHRHEQTGPDDAVVEFTARWREGGKARRMTETSRFVREDGRWFYVDGKMKDE